MLLPFQLKLNKLFITNFIKEIQGIIDFTYDGVCTKFQFDKQKTQARESFYLKYLVFRLLDVFLIYIIFRILI